MRPDNLNAAELNNHLREVPEQRVEIEGLRAQIADDSNIFPPQLSDIQERLTQNSRLQVLLKPLVEQIYEDSKQRVINGIVRNPVNENCSADEIEAMVNAELADGLFENIIKNEIYLFIDSIGNMQKYLIKDDIDEMNVITLHNLSEQQTWKNLMPHEFSYNKYSEISNRIIDSCPKLFDKYMEDLTNQERYVLIRVAQNLVSDVIVANQPSNQFQRSFGII